MITYIVNSLTNYGLMVHIVNAKDRDEARYIAVQAGAWDCAIIDELDLTKYGVIYESLP